MSDSVRPHRRQPTRFPHPWDSPGKNTGVGFHFLLQSMRVKSESEVAQSCPTLSNRMDCSLPGSSIHGIFQARVLESGAIAFSRKHFYLFLSARSKKPRPDTTDCHLRGPKLSWAEAMLWHRSKQPSCSYNMDAMLSCSVVPNTLWCMEPVAHQAPLSMGILQARILEWGAMPSSRGSSQPRDQNCILWLLHCRWILCN